MDTNGNGTTDPLKKFYHKISVGGYNLQYVKVGNGPKALLAFCGIMGPVNYTYTELIQKFEKDGTEQYTFYAYDMAGYFGSGSPIRKLSDIDFQVDVQIAADFMKAMGHSKYDILGYSAGSQIALLLAMKHPNLVNKLLLWGAWDRFEEEDVQLNLRFRNTSNVASPFVAVLHQEFGVETSSLHWDAWSDMILREYSNKDKVEWNKRFDTLRCSTLIIWGGRDLMVPRRQVDDLHRLIQNSRLLVMPKSPHNTHVIYTDEFYNAMNDFLMEADTVIETN